MSCLSANPANQFLDKETCETTCVREPTVSSNTTTTTETTTEITTSTSPKGILDPCRQDLDVGSCHPHNLRPRLRLVHLKWIGLFLIICPPTQVLLQLDLRIVRALLLQRVLRQRESIHHSSGLQGPLREDYFNQEIHWQQDILLLWKWQQRGPDRRRGGHRRRRHPTGNRGRHFGSAIY